MRFLLPFRVLRDRLPKEPTNRIQMPISPEKSEAKEE
jgi:hypothetical protein